MSLPPVASWNPRSRCNPAEIREGIFLIPLRGLFGFCFLLSNSEIFFKLPTSNILMHRQSKKPLSMLKYVPPDSVKNYV